MGIVRTFLAIMFSLLISMEDHLCFVQDHGELRTLSRRCRRPRLASSWLRAEIRSETMKLGAESQPVRSEGQTT